MTATPYLHPSTYSDNLSLLVEIRNYIKRKPPGELTADGLCDHITETTRLTARVIALFAWSLGHCAVANGEIDEEQRRRSFSLGNLPVCLEDRASVLPGELEELSDLLRRSLKRYRQCQRLDEFALSRDTMIAGQPDQDKEPEPRRWSFRATATGRPTENRGPHSSQFFTEKER